MATHPAIFLQPFAARTYTDSRDASQLPASKLTCNSINRKIAISHTTRRVYPSTVYSQQEVSQNFLELERILGYRAKHSPGRLEVTFIGMTLHITCWETVGIKIQSCKLKSMKCIYRSISAFRFLINTNYDGGVKYIPLWMCVGVTDTCQWIHKRSGFQNKYFISFF